MEKEEKPGDILIQTDGVTVTVSKALGQWWYHRECKDGLRISFPCDSVQEALDAAIAALAIVQVEVGELAPRISELLEFDIDGADAADVMSQLMLVSEVAGQLVRMRKHLLRRLDESLADLEAICS